MESLGRQSRLQSKILNYSEPLVRLDDDDLPPPSGASDHLYLAWQHLAQCGGHLWSASKAAVCGRCCSDSGTGSQSTLVVVPSEGAPAPAPASAAASYVFLPSHPWKQIWDRLIMAVVVYSSIVVPLRVCFPLATPVGAVYYLEACIALLFAADLAVSFNTAYADGGAWVRSRELIGKRYLSGWFWVDAPAAIPLELIEMAQDYIALRMALPEDEDTTEPLAMLRVLRIFRLVRLLRLFRVDLGLFKDHLEEVFHINLRIFELVSHALKLLFIAHILGCLWFYMTTIEEDNGGKETWATDAGVSKGPVAKQYLFSVYWALTTLTTVGYGDITPVSDLEKCFAIFALLVGAISFAYMLGDIGVLLGTIDRQAALVEEEIDAIKDYIQWRQLPRDLGLRVKRYYAHFYSKRSVFDETRILSNLNAQLQGEVHRVIISDTLGRLPLFAQRGVLSPAFQSAIFPLLRPLSFVAGEPLFTKGDASHDLFFLLEGEVDVMSGDNDEIPHRRLMPKHEIVLDPIEGTPILTLDNQGALGEHVLLGIRRTRTHIAHTHVEVYYLTKPDLARLFVGEPVASRRFCRAVLRSLVRRERFRRLTLRLRVSTLPYGPLRACLQIQYAWQSYCDFLARNSDPLYQLIISLQGADAGLTVGFSSTAQQGAKKDSAASKPLPGTHSIGSFVRHNTVKLPLPQPATNSAPSSKRAGAPAPDAGASTVASSDRAWASAMHGVGTSSTFDTPAARRAQSGRASVAAPGAGVSTEMARLQNLLAEVNMRVAGMAATEQLTGEGAVGATGGPHDPFQQCDHHMGDLHSRHTTGSMTASKMAAPGQKMFGTSSVLFAPQRGKKH